MSCTRCLGRGSGTCQASTHGGCFLTFLDIATCPAHRHGVCLRADLHPLQNTYVLTPGPLGCDCI